MTRRDVLKYSAATAAAAWLPAAVWADDDKPKKVLFFTKSSGYQHSIIRRKGTELSYAEKILIKLGKEKKLDITASKDGGLFTAEKLKEFDCFVFCTTGDLATVGKEDHAPAMPKEGKQALLDAVAAGKGFVALHCGSDTFHSVKDKKAPYKDVVDPYIAMLGGEFDAHGDQQKSTLKIVDAKFPGVPKEDLTLTEEWYALKNLAGDLHVILMQQTDGMHGNMYQRKAYPSTWARMHEKGRVFYTSMAHKETTWEDTNFTNLLLGGIGWACGQSEADVTANVDQFVEKDAK